MNLVSIIVNWYTANADGIDKAADIIGILSAAFALAAWINTRRISAFQRSEQKRLNEKISIRLVNKMENGQQKYIELPGKMRREELARSEVLGWLGMLPMQVKGARFSIANLNTKEFLETMNRVQAAKGDMVFVIPCTQDELDQFLVEQKILDQNGNPVEPKAAQPAA